MLRTSAFFRVLFAFSILLLIDVSIAPAMADGGPPISHAGDVIGPEFSYALAPLIKAVQLRLDELGYYDGEIDGIWGDQSAYAWWEFCYGHRLYASKGLTSEVMIALWGMAPTDTSAAGLAVFWREIGVRF